MEHTVKALICGKILTPHRIINKGLILIRDSRIYAVGEEKALTTPENADILDLRKLTVLPGFIDIHLHGWGGHDFRSPDMEHVNEVNALLPSHGVTSHLMTICNLSGKRLQDTIKRANDYISSQAEGSRAAGLHLEGPFLNPRMKGAMEEDSFSKPDLRLLKSLLKRGEGNIKMMTLSPELEGAMDLLPELQTAGVTPSAGHSDADYIQAVEAARRGIKHATHTFNAMGPLHHRKPGLAGAVLTQDTVTAEFIPDDVHLHPAAVKLLLRAKGASRTVTVTDAHPMAGLEPGNYRDLYGREVVVGNDAVRLADGKLAGGATPMNRLICNILEDTEISLAEAVATATINPARVIGIDSLTGSIEAGKDADIVAVDTAMNVRLTMARGKIVYGIKN